MARFATSFTFIPLDHHGHKEATPITIVVLFCSFFLTLAVSLMLGHVAINRWLAPKN